MKFNKKYRDEKNSGLQTDVEITVQMQMNVDNGAFSSFSVIQVVN